MKKLLVPIALLLVLALMAGCAPAAVPAPAAPAAETAPAAEPAPAPAAPAGDTSLADIQAKGYFILGLDDSFPPMGYRDDNNEIVGFDIDLAREIASRLGVEVQLQPLVWEYIGEELNGKRVDVIWNGCTITDERKEMFDFTNPYMFNQQIVTTLKDSPIKTLADLAGKTVGIQGGSSSNIALDNHPEIKDSLGELVPYSDNAMALTDLEVGRLDAVVVDATVFGYYIGIQPDTYVMLTETLGAEEFGIGVRKEDVSFREALQEALDASLADGTTLEIAKKWFGEDAATVLAE